MSQVPLRIITRDKQQLVAMERKFEKVKRQQEELAELIECKRAHLDGMEVA